VWGGNLGETRANASGGLLEVNVGEEEEQEEGGEEEPALDHLRTHISETWDFMFQQIRT